MAGYAKLSGKPVMLETFEIISVRQWFRNLTGALKSWLRPCSSFPAEPVGALLLDCPMIDAVLRHLLLIGGPPVPALVLLCFAVVILWADSQPWKHGSANCPRRASVRPNPGRVVTRPSHTQ